MNVHGIHCTLGVALLFAACGPKPSEPEQAAAPAAEKPVPEQKAAQPHADHAAAPPTIDLPPVSEGAKVWFVEPAGGAALQGPLENGKVAVPVKMGVEGIALKPAGAVEAGSGHHHILIDAELPAKGVVVPADDRHLHFGKAQTEATLWLEPGPHTLALQFADGIHRAYGPQLSATIQVTVAAAGSVGAGTAKEKEKEPATKRP